MTAQQRADVMAGTVWNTLYGPTGVAWRLPAAELGLLQGTAIAIQDRPTSTQRALVNARPSDRLLGLYTAGPGHGDAVVVLFSEEIAAVGYDPADVVVHEIGHVFQYNHASRVATVPAPDGQLGTVCQDCAPRSTAVTGTMNPHAHTPGSSDQCPVCLTWHHANTASGLLFGLRERAHLQHQIPLGLGGTIPQARREVQQAQAMLVLAAPMVPGRQGEVRALEQLFAHLDHGLDRRLRPEDVSALHAVAHRATDRAYDLNHVYWLHVLHGAAAPAAWQP